MGSERIKVYQTGDRGIEVEEVDLEQAREIVEEARRRGRCVVDKTVGEIITELKPETQEVLIFDIIQGG